MCIRDSHDAVDQRGSREVGGGNVFDQLVNRQRRICQQGQACLLYTSDAADERSSVDLGGRRIIKKKNRVSALSQGVR